MAARKISPVILAGSEKSNITFILLHGYTGSPEDFGDLPQFLHQTFHARVHVPLLVGHGTTVQDLLRYSYRDFFRQTKEIIESELRSGAQVIVGGFSLGALLALDLGARLGVAGIFMMSPPVRLTFPANIPGLPITRFIKPLWKKKFSQKERDLVGPIFFYDDMPVLSITVRNAAMRSLRKPLSSLNVPTLAVFSEYDKISSLRGVKFFARHAFVRVIVGKNPLHRPATADFKMLLKNQIVQFVKNSVLREGASISKSEKILTSAIVPAMNEADRIGQVLSVLTQTPALDEIIVVDDGSSDRTAEVARSFPQVRVLRNEKNQGKAAAMDHGVRESRGEIIFFCDADLSGLTPEIVEEIIAPVREEKFDMYIGLRQNKMQQAVTLFAINSGERALRRELWEKLPAFFKTRYRVEAGLNYYARHSHRGLGYRTFPYFQTLKETKYGFVKGTALRWSMNFDVFRAYLRLYLSPKGK
ncbi:MAG TPA: alpha/beta fold hydrolase [Candidatus Paceibacterota bacterium]|nr:alpha/beta fold hydrolase [Candidatus Paceibacterota bacterium]